MDMIIANSRPTAGRVQALGVAPNKIQIVHPGVSLPTAPQTAEALRVFRQRYALGHARVLLSVGRLTTRKGLREFVQHSLPEIVRQAPDVLLAIVGDAPTDSLLAEAQTPASIQAVAEAAGIGQHLRFLGVITDPHLLACAYECAALHVFPVREIPNDPEGFGMVAIEAAAHDLPTVAFTTGGIVDAVAHGLSGYLVENDDYLALARQTVAALNDPLDGKQVQAFAQGFAWDRFGASVASCLGL